nr:transposase [Mobiluncus mulieris]
MVHLIRASLRFVSYKDRRAVAAALKPIYQAIDEEQARGCQIDCVSWLS